MKISLRTEYRYGLVLVASSGLVLGLLLQLLQKYSIGNLSQVAEMCTDVAVQLSYSTFNRTGQIIGLSLMLLVGILIVKTLFSIVKTYQKTQNLLALKTLRHSKNFQHILQKISLSDRDIVLVKCRQPVAITIGLWQPKIIVSTGLMNNLKSKQLIAVLLHEKYHFTHRHPILFCIGEVVGQSLSFVPVVKELGSFFRTQLEHEADQFAITQQGTDLFIKQSLAKLHVGTNHSVYPAFVQPNIRRKTPIFTFKNILLSIVVVMALFGLAVLPVSVEAGVTHASGQLQDCSEISREDCSRYCQSSGFKFLDFETKRSVENKF